MSLPAPASARGGARDETEEIFGYTGSGPSQEPLVSPWPAAAADAGWPGLDPDSPRRRKRWRLRAAVCVAVFAVVAVAAFFLVRVARAKVAGVLGLPPGLWARDGVLTVGKETRFRVKGISWYGMEQVEHCLEGLEKVAMGDVLDLVGEFGFNAVAVPLAMDVYERNPTIGAECLSTFVNPRLKELKYRGLLRHLVDEAERRNLLVLFDLHRLEAKVWPGDGRWHGQEDRILDFWTSLTKEYKSQWNVIGADVFNEPHGAKTWESWRQFAEKVGNHIQKHAPRWLVVVEGVAQLDKDKKENKTDLFWAENLRYAGDDPPVLKEQRKLVLSPHVYGPSVANHSYFKVGEFPKNMPAIWDEHFGLSVKSGAALIVGEWGGRHFGQDRVWGEAFVEYLSKKEFGFFYWVLNPESKDTAGFLLDDWKTVDPAKAELLKKTKSTKVEDHLYHFKRGI